MNAGPTTKEEATRLAFSKLPAVAMVKLVKGHTHAELVKNPEEVVYTEEVVVEAIQALMDQQNKAQKNDNIHIIAMAVIECLILLVTLYFGASEGTKIMMIFILGLTLGGLDFRNKFKAGE